MTLLYNMNFAKFVKTHEIQDAKLDLANHLIESGVDIEKFTQAMIFLDEWQYNPLKTFGKGIGAGAGATIGAGIAGPVGALAGGMLGSKIADLGNKAIGSAVKKVTVEPIEPLSTQALKAVDVLATQLNNPQLASIPGGEEIQKAVQIAQNNLKMSHEKIPQFDQAKKQAFDQQLTANDTGGVGAKLRGSSNQALSWLGKKIETIPALNQDMGLRRAIAKGMDAVQQWASDNPKKASLLNLASGAVGTLAGAGAKSAFDYTVKNVANTVTQTQDLASDSSEGETNSDESDSRTRKRTFTGIGPVTRK